MEKTEFKCIKELRMQCGDLAFEKGKIYPATDRGDKWKFDRSEYVEDHYILYETLDEYFEKVVNELPEKWCIQLTDQLVVDYCNKFGKCPTYTLPDEDYKSYAHFPSFGGSCTTSGEIKPGYTEITLEQFKTLVLGQDGFKLPEKWYCLLKNREHFEIANKHFNKSWSYCNGEGGCTNLLSSNNWWNTDRKPKSDEIEITFEQFEKYVMKEKEIIGYKLIKPEYNEAALKIVKIIAWNIREELDLCKGSIAEDYLEEAGVLDLWFEPVYKDSTPEVTIKGHKSELKGGAVKFGCQVYSNQFVIELDDFLSKNTFDIRGYQQEIRKLATFLRDTKK